MSASFRLPSLTTLGRHHQWHHLVGSETSPLHSNQILSEEERLRTRRNIGLKPADAPHPRNQSPTLQDPRVSEGPSKDNNIRVVQFGSYKELCLPLFQAIPLRKLTNQHEILITKENDQHKTNPHQARRIVWTVSQFIVAPSAIKTRQEVKSLEFHTCLCVFSHNAPSVTHFWPLTLVLIPLLPSPCSKNNPRYFQFELRKSTVRTCLVMGEILPAVGSP